MVVVVLTVVTTAQHLAFETTAKSEVETTLEQPEYEELGLVSVSTEYATRGVVPHDQMVTVTVSKPTGDEALGLEAELWIRISEATDEEIVVEVQFVEYAQAGGETNAVTDPGSDTTNTLS